MEVYTLDLPESADLRDAAEVIERRVASAGLMPALQGALRKYPQSVHWHYKKPGRKGTLEITLAPNPNRLWLTIHTGRSADWIAAVVDRLITDLPLHLHGTSQQPPLR